MLVPKTKVCKESLEEIRTLVKLKDPLFMVKFHENFSWQGKELFVTECFDQV